MFLLKKKEEEEEAEEKGIHLGYLRKVIGRQSISLVNLKFRLLLLL